MAESRAQWRWLPLLLFGLALYVIARVADTPQAGTPLPAGSAAASSSPSAAVSPSASVAGSPYDPVDYTVQIRARARQAGISAQLLLAILYNESYKPHDPDVERAWQRYKPNASFGIANMHRATFDEVKQGRDFGDRRWDELPDDRDLAIEAEAWYLHDLAALLPAQLSASYSKNELLALGYNTGAGNMLAFAHGATPGSQAQSYLDRLHANWSKAGAVIARRPH
ncbi:lytic transglycosylase domain-containing protein [Streptomyces sp. NPDC057963]|uniref:lytic transglycosylase domain-containing protein n=1 Tax=Streptomyces sp. NPDC057963 TaxID=3346290 RepID=UPI0036E518F9